MHTIKTQTILAANVLLAFLVLGCATYPDYGSLRGPMNQWPKVENDPRAQGERIHAQLNSKSQPFLGCFAAEPREGSIFLTWRTGSNGKPKVHEISELLSGPITDTMGSCIQSHFESLTLDDPLEGEVQYRTRISLVRHEVRFENRGTTTKEFNNVLIGRGSQVGGCLVSAELEVGTEIEGEAEVALLIGPDGSVQDSMVRANSKAESWGECIASLIRPTHFHSTGTHRVITFSHAVRYVPGSTIKLRKW